MRQELPLPEPAPARSACSLAVLISSAKERLAVKYVTDHCLTIRSSRARFAVSTRSHSPDAGRLNSGVSAQKKQISAKSFFDKRHKSFSDPLSPALRHISDLIHLRAVSDLLAPGNLSHPRHRAYSQLQRANNSFKPTPLRGVVVTSSHPSAPASATLLQRRGLIQALD